MRQVGHGQQQVLQLGLNHLQPRAGSFQLGLHRAHLRHHRVGLGVLSFALEHADLLGQAVALALQLFGARLQRLALGLQRAESVHVQESLGLFAGFEPGDHGVEVFSQ